MSPIKRPLSIRPHLRSALHARPALTLLGVLAAAAPVTAAPPTGQEGASMLTVLLVVVLAAIALAALVIAGLVLWGRKQEHIGDMMLFCMKYLVHSEDEAERCASARALGRVKDPGALLVLVNVVWDEDQTDAVRAAASEALHDMGGRFRTHKKTIAELELKAEQRDFRGIIDILTAHFERGDTRYVQSAYIIGRHYMRLGNYADAREWLTKAESRNRKFNLYGNRIGEWIRVCNVRLLEEADDSYKAGDYQQAREHYAVLAHGLSDEDRKRCAVYLRSACVYCKLQDYRNADQAILQALGNNHATDLCLTLVPLLQEMLRLADKDAASPDTLEGARSAIDERVNAIASALLAQYTLRPTTQQGDA